MSRCFASHVRAVLDAFVAAESHMTAHQVQKATGLDADLVQSAIKELCLFGIVVRVGDRLDKPGAGGRFAHHSKLRAAPPAQPEKADPWRGVDWTTATLRPGCLDHLKYPSRRGDELVMHTGEMVHVASMVREFASEIRKGKDGARK